MTRVLRCVSPSNNSTSLSARRLVAIVASSQRRSCLCSPGSVLFTASAASQRARGVAVSGRARIAARPRVAASGQLRDRRIAGRGAARAAAARNRERRHWKESRDRLALLVGLLMFFVLEKMVLWRHCHQEVCEGHVPHGTHHGSRQRRDAASASLILIGDGFHNVLDGVLIAAAFMTDVHLGVVTALAVIAHEIPQEVGDLAILLHGGMSRLRALTLNLLTSLTSVVGGVAAYFASGRPHRLLPYAIAHRRIELSLHRRGRPDPGPAPPRRPRLRRQAVRVHRAGRGGDLREPRAGALVRAGLTATARATGYGLRATASRRGLSLL